MDKLFIFFTLVTPMVHTHADKNTRACMRRKLCCKLFLQKYGIKIEIKVKHFI